VNLGSIAARNIGRNKVRTAMTVLGGVVALTAFVLIRTVIAAWNVAVEYAAKDRLATRHKVSFVIPLPKKYMDVIRGDEMKKLGVKESTWLNWFGARDPRFPDEFFANCACDAPSFLAVYDEVVLAKEDRERWLGDRQGAILGDVLARKLGVKVGDRLTLQGTIFPGDWTFNVSGIYTASRKSMDRSQLFFHWDYLNDTVNERVRERGGDPDEEGFDKIGWVVSRIDDPARGADISAAIDRAFEERDDQTETMSEKQMQNSFMGMFSAILTALDIVSFIILAILGMILGNTVAMGVRERTNEYGVLRALGFSPGHVFRLVLGEAVAVGVVAGIVGMAVAFPFVELGMGRWLEEYMGAWFPYFRIDGKTLVLGFLLPVALGAVGALIPAFQASRLSVTDALRRVA